MAAGRCQSPRPEPSPGKRSPARVLRLPPRQLELVQLGELARVPLPPLLPTPSRRQRGQSLAGGRWGGAAKRTEHEEVEAEAEAEAAEK